MNCPNCGGKIKDTNQKFCEFCGNELIKSNNPSSPDEIKVKVSPTRSKRRCC